MKVAITTARKDDACAMYRIKWPAEALRDQNQIDLLDGFDLNFEMKPGFPPTVVGVEKLDADVLILQRPAGRNIVDAIRFYQEQGIAVVVDLDDDLERLDPSHSGYPFYHPKTSPHNNWEHLKRACSIADMVVVSTSALRRYAAHGRVEVIRNYMPLSYLEIARDSAPGRVIGWGGTVSSHPRDLQVTRGGVGEAVSQLNAEFKVIGDGKGVQEALNLPDRPMITGMVDFDEFVEEVATFDVAIAPLISTTFGKAKSWLKPLEAAAVGVPSVCSQTPEYELLLDYLGDGIEVVPDRSRNWVQAIKRQMEIAQDPVERGLLRQYVADELTIDVNAYRWLTAWEEAVAHRRSV